MPETKQLPVKDLRLDLRNFRTIPQTDEMDAVLAMIAISPDRFWALMESLLDDGYLPTENILLLKGVTSDPTLVVKEGNRRVGALKLILGYIPDNGLDIPGHITKKISSLPSTWKTSNEQIPCTVYENQDASIVDQIVTLAHGKGERAGRDQWKAIARARHNRDINKANESALDLLEKYLKTGNNFNLQQAERWAGDYPLSVLDEATKKISMRFGVSNATELARKYPDVPFREALDNILKNIGLELINFNKIRDKNKDFAAEFGLPAVLSAASSVNTAKSGKASRGAGGPSDPSTSKAVESQSTGKSLAHAGTATPSEPVAPATTSTTKKTLAQPINDPKAVLQTLKRFRPRGDNREKVVTLRDEALRLKLDKNPLAFCFLLRSMFEISAKAYCEDHKANGGPQNTKSDGKDKRLVDVLGDIKKHLTNNNSDLAMTKSLHGAMTELGKPDGILSVTSMNQLVHNPSFSVQTGDLCILFGNIFPLLEAMNR